MDEGTDLSLNSPHHSLTQMSPIPSVRAGVEGKGKIEGKGKSRVRGKEGEGLP